MSRLNVRKLERELREQAKAKALQEWETAEAERIEKLAQEFRTKYGKEKS